VPPVPDKTSRLLPHCGSIAVHRTLRLLYPRSRWIVRSGANPWIRHSGTPGYSRNRTRTTFISCLATAGVSFCRIGSGPSGSPAAEIRVQVRSLDAGPTLVRCRPASTATQPCCPSARVPGIARGRKAATGPSPERASVPIRVDDFTLLPIRNPFTNGRKVPKDFRGAQNGVRI